MMIYNTLKQFNIWLQKCKRVADTKSVAVCKTCRFSSA